MSEDGDAENIVRRLFIFIKENINVQCELDELIQRQLLDVREREEFICKDNCEAFWCERYLKRLIMKKTCKKFIAFIHEMPRYKHVSDKILETQKNVKDASQSAMVDVQRSPYTLTYEMLQTHIYFLYGELEPREIADEMFQSGCISCNDHDSVTENQRKYVRFMNLLDIVKEKNLCEPFARILQSSTKYKSVLKILQTEKKTNFGHSEYALCIQYNFTLLQEQLPNADYVTEVMGHLLDQTNKYDIGHCEGEIRQKSKLLKILLLKGKRECMELFKVVGENLKREDLLQTMKERIDYIETRGRPGLSPKLQSLSTLCLEEQKEFLLEELEPKYLCDLLLEERAIEIMIHDKITEITDRRPQIIALLQTLQKNENECFHYFLYIIEKTEFDSIRCEFESLASFGSARDETNMQTELRSTHTVEKVSDNPRNESIKVQLKVKSPNAEELEQDLFHRLERSAPVPFVLTMAHGLMDIENMFCGSVVLQLRPLTDQAVQTLLNAKKNNKLFDIVFGMLKNVNIADKMSDTEPLEIKVQVYYASSAEESPKHGHLETRNAEQIKHRLKAYRNKLISDVEPSALASALSKSFPKCAFDTVEHADNCRRRVERLLALVEKGEPDLVREFVTVLNKFGYHEIVELLNPPDILQKAKNIRKKIAYNFNRILEEMQLTLAKETLLHCIGDVDGITQTILPRNGNRRKRMSNFLQFILKEDHNVIEFEKMLKHNGLEKLLNIDETVPEELVSTQNIEATFVKDTEPSSSDILFESVITLSNTEIMDNGRGRSEVYLIYSEESPEERRFAEGALRERLESRGLTVRSEADFLAGTNLVRGRSGAVQDCSKALILLTENSNNSSWCTLELLLALEKSYRLNSVSLVVLKISASREWKFQLALEMLNVVPRVDLSSFTELSENEGKFVELVRKLQDTRGMDDMQPAGNIAHAQVWSHYTGLLSYLLPEIERLIKETEYYKLDPSRFPLKLYELVPERCNCPRIIEDIPKNELGKRIKLMPKKTSTIEYFRAGNKRVVDMSIYEIKDIDGSVYYCLMEIPAVLSGIQTMIENKTPEKLREIDLQLHIKRFYYTLGGLLDDRSFPQTYDRARVITYDEQQSGFVLADVVLNEVKKDLCSPNEKKVPPQHFQHAECEFDAFVFIHEGDENTSDEITHFLEGKGVKLMRNDRIGLSILNISDVIKRFRWIIPILSKTSLKDPVFAHCCLMLVGDILEKKELRMIPVLTGGAAYEDVPEVIRMVTLTIADNPEYLNRLHQTIKGNTIPFETDSLLPAGDVVYVLAWNYAVNYLEKVMPGLERVIAETLQKHNKRPTSCRKKLYLIVPKSCECNNTLTVKEPRIQLLATTPPAYVDKSGRKYTFDMYQFENNGREHYFVGLYPAAVACIHDMYKTKRAGINEDTMVSQARKFCEEIANVLNHKVSANFTNLCEVVFYDDREMSLITEMTKRIESL